MSKHNLMGTAGALAERFGEKLIGQRVLTEQIGDWPGGWATVVEIEPDENAPEIVFQVSHPVHGEIGVFDHETILFAG